MHAIRFVALAITSVATAACHFGGKAETIDAGDRVERDIAVGTFQRVAVSGPFDVEVKADGKPGVHVSGGEKLIEEAEFAVDGDTLKIRTRKNNVHWRSGDSDSKIHVVVSGGGAISGASIAGSGNLSVERVKAANFDGEVAGSGDLRVASLETGAARLSIAGSGNLEVAGRAQSAKMEIAGSGDIDGQRLNTADAEVSIAGSGNVAANATGSAKVTVMGSGDVSITGGAKCQISKQGSGNISCS